VARAHASPVGALLPSLGNISHIHKQLDQLDQLDQSEPGALLYDGLDSLPPAVSLLTVEPQPDGAAFVRLAHRFGANEAGANATAEVSLATLFATQATSAEEYSLNGLIPMASTRQRLVWKVKGESPTAARSLSSGAPKGSALTVQMAPMEVRAFMLRFD
jgi:alpha-mannosidase